MSVDPDRLIYAVLLVMLAAVLVPVGLSFVKAAYVETAHPRGMLLVGAVTFLGGIVALYGADTFAPLVGISPLLAVAVPLAECAAPS